MLHKQLFLAAIIMLGMMTACHNDDCKCDRNDFVEAKFTGQLNEMNSRVMGNKWTYDKIGIRVIDAKTSNMMDLYKNCAYETESQGLTAMFTPVTPADAIFFQDKTEIVTFAAYLPYVASDPNVLPGTNGIIGVNTQDNNNNETEQLSINYLYATGASASKMDPIVAFTKISDTEDYSFKHKMSRIRLIFKASLADGFTGDEIFENKLNTYNLGGLKLKGTFNVTTGLASSTAEPTEIWDITNCIHWDDHANKSRTYTLILLPQTSNPSSKLKVSINLNGTTYTNDRTIDANLVAGKSYTYTIILKKNGLEISGSTITDWVEVPNEEGAATTE